MPENPYQSPTTEPEPVAGESMGWRLSTAVVLVGVGVFYLYGALRHTSPPARIAMAVIGALWIAAGVCVWAKHRGWAAIAVGLAIVAWVFLG